MKSKKRLKRFLAVVMTMIMVLSMSTINVIAATTTVEYDSTQQASNGGKISVETTTNDTSGYTEKTVTKYNDGTKVTVEYTYNGSDVIKTKTTTQVYTDTTFEQLSAQTIVTVDVSDTNTTVTTTQEYDVDAGTPTLSTTTKVTVVTETGKVTTTTEVTDSSGSFTSKTVETVETTTQSGLVTKVVTTTETYSNASTVQTTVVEEVTYEYNTSSELERTTTVTKTYRDTVSDNNLTSTVTEISGVKDSSTATYTLTIDNNVSGYEYTAYQVFKGDLYDVYTSLDSSTAANYSGQLYTYDATSETFLNATYDATAASNGTVYYSKTSTLSNIEWGDNMDTTKEIGKLTLIQAIQAITTSGSDTPFSGVSTAADVAGILTGKDNDSEEVQLFAEAVAPYVKPNSGKTSTPNTVTTVSDDVEFAGSYTISGLAPGYYFVSSTDVPANASASRYMLTVVSNQEIESKTDKSTVEKKVDEVSASIGDTVTYTLTATLPSNYADYDDYTLIFHDTLSDGLTYKDDSVTMTVYTYVEATGIQSFTSGKTYYTLSNGVYTKVDTTVVTSPASSITYYTLEEYTASSDSYKVYKPGYTKVDVDETTFNSNSSSYYIFASDTGTYSSAGTTYSSSTQYYTKNDNDSNTLDICIGDTNDLYVTSAGDIITNNSSWIVVTYKATINENAVIGNGTNTEGYGNTNAVALEYSNNPNSGGEGQTGTTTTELVTTFTFELDVTKVNSDGDTLEGAEFVLYKKDGDVGSETTYYAILDADNKISSWTTDKNQAIPITSDSNGKFSIIGLGEGIYYLEETKAPAGYNLLSEALTIVISAQYDTNNSAVTVLSATVSTTNGSSNWSGVIATGAISGSVENNAGSPIPSTGGMGTTILYIIGAILVIGAAVILVTRRRMANK